MVYNHAVCRGGAWRLAINIRQKHIHAELAYVLRLLSGEAIYGRRLGCPSGVVMQAQMKNSGRYLNSPLAIRNIAENADLTSMRKVERIKAFSSQHQYPSW